MAKTNFAGYTIRLPGHPAIRVGLGIALIIAGILGFLPILGFWMIPLGLLILSVDLRPVRKFRRHSTVKFGAWLHRRYPKFAKRFGYGAPRHGKHV